MQASSQIIKYSAIAKLTVRNHLAYVMDFLVRSVFLLIILYIFIQLWQTTFHGEGETTIAGYTFKQMIWYLIVSESITMAFPSLATKVEEEVKSGDIGYQLTRPVSYLWFHFVGYMGEVGVRFTVNIIIGGVLGVLVLGTPHFGWGWAGLFIIIVGSIAVNFLLNMSIALCAFWVEETRGLEFVYHKILFTIGGMLMPLEIFPTLLQKICAWLPFQTVLYFPAKTTVNFDGGALLNMVGIQCIWIVLLGIVVRFIYRRGVKKLNVNGG